MADKKSDPQSLRGPGATPAPSKPPVRPLHRTQLLQIHGAISEFCDVVERMATDIEDRGEGSELLTAVRGQSEQLADLGSRFADELWPKA